MKTLIFLGGTQEASTSQKMRTRVLLNLEGKHCFVGLLSADRMGALFQYAPEFVADGLEVSPLSCPLRASVFRGIPGFVSDSLPDG